MSVQPGQVAAGTFAAKPGTNAAPFAGRVNHARTGTSGRAKGHHRRPRIPHRAPGEEVAGAQGPGAAGICTTPTSSSWLNLIERWFKELNDKRLRRGVFTSVADLTAAITEWAEPWNTDPKPFVWKATAEQIITKVRRTSKSDGDVKPSTGLKLRRTTRPPGSHLGLPD